MCGATTPWWRLGPLQLVAACAQFMSPTPAARCGLLLPRPFLPLPVGVLCGDGGGCSAARQGRRARRRLGFAAQQRLGHRRDTCLIRPHLVCCGSARVSASAARSATMASTQARTRRGIVHTGAPKKRRHRQPHTRVGGSPLTVPAPLVSLMILLMPLQVSPCSRRLPLLDTSYLPLATAGHCGQEGGVRAQGKANPHHTKSLVAERLPQRDQGRQAVKCRCHATMPRPLHTPHATVHYMRSQPKAPCSTNASQPHTRVPASATGPRAPRAALRCVAAHTFGMRSGGIAMHLSCCR